MFVIPVTFFKSILGSDEPPLYYEVPSINGKALAFNSKALVINKINGAFGINNKVLAFNGKAITINFKTIS